MKINKVTLLGNWGSSRASNYSVAHVKNILRRKILLFYNDGMSIKHVF